MYPVPFASPDERVPVQAAAWSPQSNALAYVTQNDVYFLADVTNGQAKRLTTNGAFNAVYNGIADWTYQGKLHSRYFHLLSLCLLKILENQ